MKKTVLTIIIASIVVISLGVLLLITKDKLLASVAQQGGTEFRTYKMYEFFTASSTAGNPRRFASSTEPTLILGAKKVTFEFAVAATSTVNKIGEFQVWVSANSEAAEENFTRYGNLVVTPTTTPDTDTADEYYTRKRIVAVVSGATSTASMDLTYDTFKSMLCTASSSWHGYVTCSAIVEW